MTDTPQFGDLVRAARLERDWSQAELAGRLGVRQPAVSGWENNNRTPATVTLFLKVCAVLGIDLDQARAALMDAGTEYEPEAS